MNRDVHQQQDGFAPQRRRRRKPSTWRGTTTQISRSLQLGSILLFVLRLSSSPAQATVAVPPSLSAPTSSTALMKRKSTKDPTITAATVLCRGGAGWWGSKSKEEESQSPAEEQHQQQADTGGGYGANGEYSGGYPQQPQSASESRFEGWPYSYDDQNESRRPGQDYQGYYDPNSQQQNYPAPPPGYQPPPPPEPPEKPRYSQNPIHYQFAARSSSSGPPDSQSENERQQFGRTPADAPVDFIPETTNEVYNTPDGPFDSRHDHEEDEPKFASARNDAVTRYMSGSTGQRLRVRTSAAAVGAGLGLYVAKSLGFGSSSHSWATAVGFLFLVLTWFRSDFGEWSRALGLTLVLAVSRFQEVRRRYPTWIHVKASIGLRPRQPFPPMVDNPWAYRPDAMAERQRERRRRRQFVQEERRRRGEEDEDDRYGLERRRREEEDEDDLEIVNFNMLYTVIAMGFCGSACGGSIPLLPTWMGSLAGAVVFLLSTQTRDARGDLSRTMGMRVVALLQQVLEIQRDVGLWPKTGRVATRILDKLLILDRKHSIRERLVSAFSFAADQASAATRQMQQQAQQRRGGEEDGGRGSNSRRDEDRPPWLGENGRRQRPPDERRGRGGPPPFRTDTAGRPRNEEWRREEDEAAIRGDGYPPSFGAARRS